MKCGLRIVCLPFLLFVLTAADSVSMSGRQTSNAGLHGVILLQNGSSVVGRLEAADSVAILTPDGERHLALESVDWILHAEGLARVRVHGKRELVAGSVQTTTLRLWVGDRVQLIALRDVGFVLLSKAAPVIPIGGRIGRLSAFEAGGGIFVLTVLVAIAGPHSSMQILLAPERWAGSITISDPVYPRTVGNQQNFDVKVDIRGDDGAYRNLQERSGELALALHYDATGAGGSVNSSLLQPIMRSLPSEPGEKRTISVSFPMAFKTFDREVGGTGHVYISPVRIDRKALSGGRDIHFDRFIGGRLEVLRTVGDVLRLPISITKQ